MKTFLPKVIVTFCLILFILSAHAQRKDISMAQPDNRFTVFAQRAWISLSGDEKYFFYVQNNTNDEYTLEITIKLHLACDGWKTFKLGYGGIRLKPKEIFYPINGGEYSVLGGNSEQKKTCRLKDGDNYTFLISANFHMTNIVNVTQENAANKKRAEEDRSAKLKELEEQKKLAENRRKQEEADRKEKAEANKKETTTTNPKPVLKEDDVWNSGNKSTSKSNTSDESTLPDLFRTTDGRYFKKSDGQLQQISFDDYMNLQNQKSKQLTLSQQGKNLSPEEQKKIVDQVVADNNAAFNNYFKSFDDANRNYLLNAQAISAGNQISEIKDELYESSNLNGNYQSVDQLLSEFNQKMANVNRMTIDLNTQRNIQLNAAVDARFNQPGYEASIGEGMKIVGSIIHSAKADKERKEAQEQLRLQKQLALNKIAAEEKKLLTDIRKDLFTRFNEAVFPNSSSRINAQTLYFFSYSYDPLQIGNKQATLYISNIFQIDRYSDGTWPFKNNIVSELSNLTPNKEIIHGYYNNAEVAEQMQQGMIKIFTETGGIINSFNYKGKKINKQSGTSGQQDFWGNSKQTIKDSTNQKLSSDSILIKTPRVNDNFWNN